MALPISPTKILALGEPIPSELINDIQIAIVGNHDGKHAGRWEPIQPFDGGFGTGIGTFEGSDFNWFFGASAFRHWALPLPTGARLLGVRMRVNPTSGTNTATLTIVKATDGTPGGSPADSVTTSGTGAQTITLTLATPVEGAIGVTYYAKITQSAGGGSTYAYTLEMQTEQT